MKARWLAGEPQLGIFARLTVPEPYEALALAGPDLLVFDVEHGCFDRASLSRCIFAAKAGGIPTLARMPDGGLPAIQNAIGAGVDGIIVPHVVCPGDLDAVARFARGPAIERAHAGASRSARFRETSWDTFRQEAERLLVIAQIDEPESVAAAEAIAEVDGIDGAFIGRISLSLAMRGRESAVDEALIGVCEAFTRRKRLVGMSLPDQDRAPYWLGHGVALFVIDGDQRLLLNAARSRIAQYRSALRVDPEGS